MKYDYIIVGSGIAGLYTAMLAKNHGSVLIITKGSIDDCNTRLAQGGIAAAIGKHDSPELHLQDTLNAGKGLCDPEAVQILVNEAPARIADLVNFGVIFDTVNGEIALTKEAAHSEFRILHAGGDATGKYIELTLSHRVGDSKIRVLEDCLATGIVVADDRVTGIKALDTRTGFTQSFDCRFLILATGGAGQLYKLTTNPEIATGDGMKLAYEAGAEIIDMEFFQFHPTALSLPGVTPFLISEAVRGEGGILRNRAGHRFMPDYTPDAELAPRDVVARSILYEMRKTGASQVYIDATHMPPNIITTRFPQIYRFCIEHGLDITRNQIPVAPAAHYIMGGIRTNTWGETNIAGLFAVGEVACTGVHGANRLASNSLLEAIVFGQRIVERTALTDTPQSPTADRSRDLHHPLSPPGPSRPATPPSLANLQQMLWDKVGIIRSGDDLKEAASILAAWHNCLPPSHDRPSHELRNLILAGRLMTEAALTREESRGAHFRSDFPSPRDEWHRRIVLVKDRK